jgi:probable rRNA maturation factor
MMLRELELEHMELSVLLTGDGEIQKLNGLHRGKPRPTDVLAFPLGGATDEDGLLGDVVISLETAARQALGRRRPLEDEVRFLLAHGLAHLLGYDHATKSQKVRMDRVTRRLVRAARVRDATQSARRARTKHATRRRVKSARALKNR